MAGGADAADDLPRVDRRRRARPGRSRRARPSWRRRRTRQARRSGSARSSTTTTPTSRCRRSARDTAARAGCAISVIAAASSADVWSFHSQACAARLPVHARVDRQRARRRVDRQRRRAGRVDADADHAVARKSWRPLCRRQRAAHRRAQALDVVGRILAREVRIAWIQQDALVAARIVEDAACRSRARPRSRRRPRGRSWSRSQCQW